MADPHALFYKSLPIWRHQRAKVLMGQTRGDDQQPALVVLTDTERLQALRRSTSRGRHLPLGPPGAERNSSLTLQLAESLVRTGLLPLLTRSQ